MPTGDKTSEHQISRFIGVFMSGTLISRVTGLVRDILLAKWVGAISLDTFILAFKFPNMLRDIVGEGALNAAFVPTFSHSLVKDSRAEFERLVRAVMGMMVLVLGLLTLFGVLLLPLLLNDIDGLRHITGEEPPPPAQIHLLISLAQWCFPYLFMVGLSVFAMGPLFALKCYGAPSWSPSLLNIALVASCLLFRDSFSDPAYALAIGVWLGGIAQMAVLWWTLGKRSGVWAPSFELNHPAIGGIIKLMLPVIIGQAAGEANKVIDGLFAYSLESGTVVAFFYANRIVQLPLAMFGASVAVAILPSLSTAGARSDLAEVRRGLLYGLRQCFFLIAPASMALVALGEPIIRLLFERGAFTPESTTRTASILAISSWGLIAFALVKVAVQGFFGLKDTKTPVIASSISMGMNILLNFLLIGPLGYKGLAYATSISFALNLAILYAVLWRRIGPLWSPAFLSGIVRMSIAAVMSGAAAYGLALHLGTAYSGGGLYARAIAALVPLTLAGVLYLSVAWALQVPEIVSFAQKMRKRLGG